MTSVEQPVWVNVPCVNRGVTPLIGSGHACARHNDSLYIFGERNLPTVPIRSSSANRPSNNFYEYNLVKKEWTSLSGSGVAPSQRKSHSVVIYKDSLFVFGGFDGDRRLNDFYSYNFLTQTWTDVFVNAGQSPTPRFGHAAVVYDNEMYIFGGNDNHYDRESLSSRSSSEYGRPDSGRHVNDMHSFSLETNSWSLIRATGEVPYPRDGASIVVYNHNGLLFGGYDRDLGCLNDVHLFNFETRVWSRLETKGTPPTVCNHPLVTLYKNSLIVFGGKMEPNLYQLDLETNTWEAIAYAGPSPQNSSPLGCIYGSNLIIVSEEEDMVCIQQLSLPEKCIDVKPEEELEPNEDSTVVTHLRSLINNPLMSDVTFLVEGEPIFSHKSLCVRCEYFKAMFTGEMKESTARVVEIADVSRATFLSILEYVYTDRVAVADDGVLELLIAADRYGIEKLRRLCAQRLSKTVTVDNVSSILQAADQHNSPSLRDKCFAFTLQNFDIVSKTPSFVQMARTDIELALQILQNR
ncbi:Kelch repeat-containing proteins [Plasmopara halstedii]|uniref:Kelch repeat-containing proteins n=1 Tax=Plasmopara halstedii TaxID=4781 RepID=A0A0P1AUN2_PLAHL|nr:Kelch repeat-containing proteins [Plasmopara halstedii]CEG46013.1 Kelch repeat-containing proteins [Plasmopara halstedii]|eukprot:XP_024582382.1 Kelch repeat-containing proteins [Plasmopara halstedii]